MIEEEIRRKVLKQQREASFEIKNSASEINMISINAAIESAHAATGIRNMMEHVLDQLMASLCRCITKVLETGTLKMEVDEIDKFAKFIDVDEIFITDADGVTVGTNSAAALGWRFPDDPKAQAVVFRSLIGQNDGIVTQPIAQRDLDNTMFKFVGVSRTDEPGIVQVGFKAESIMRYQAEVGQVFGVLATEIKRLGEKMNVVLKNMDKLTNEIEEDFKGDK